MKNLGCQDECFEKIVPVFLIELKIRNTCSPNRRPAVLSQVLLVLRVETTQQLRRHLTQLVVVDAEVVHAPVRQLVSVVQLEKQKQ